MSYTVTHDVTSSQRSRQARPPRRLSRRRPGLHPRRRLAAYDAHRGRPSSRRIPDDDLPHLGRHAAAARRPDDPRVGRRRRREPRCRGPRAAARLDRLVGDIVGTVQRLRENELFVRIVELDPELLLPYLLSRRGRSQDAILAMTARSITEGQAAGTMRAGNPVAMARGLLLAAHGHVLSAAHDGRRRGNRRRARRRAHPPADQEPRPVTATRITPGLSLRSDRGRRRRDRARHHRHRRRPRRGHPRPLGAGRRRPRPRLRHLALVLQAGPRRPALPRSAASSGSPTRARSSAAS